MVDRATDLRSCLDQPDVLETTPSQNHCALHAGWAGADDDHLAIGPLRSGDLLGVPAAPELFASRRILGACDPIAALHTAHADVAADALDNVVDPSLPDLAGQIGIGDRRPRTSNEVPDARPDDLYHHVG